MSDTIVYDNIFEAIRAIDPYNIILQQPQGIGGIIRHQNYTLLDMGDGTIGAFTLELSKTYYRGESGEYDQCLSSLQRLKDEERMLWQIKTEDFILLMKRNKEIQRKIAQKEYLEFTALAQHYGFPTNMLDVTNDVIVAAYFATHELNNVTGEFEIKQEGVGRIRWRSESLRPSGRLAPIGLQAFQRPGAQSAYGIYLEEGEDYATESGNVLFKQDANANLQFHQMILGGPQMFFPQEDILILVEKIVKAPCVTSEAVNIFCQEQGREYEAVKDYLKSAGVAIVDAPVADWCMVRGLFNSQPSFVRKPQLRPIFSIG